MRPPAGSARALSGHQSARTIAPAQKVHRKPYLVMAVIRRFRESPRIIRHPPRRPICKPGLPSGCRRQGDTITFSRPMGFQRVSDARAPEPDCSHEFAFSTVRPGCHHRDDLLGRGERTVHRRQGHAGRAVSREPGRDDAAVDRDRDGGALDPAGVRQLARPAEGRAGDVRAAGVRAQRRPAVRVVAADVFDAGAGGPPRSISRSPVSGRCSAQASG